MLNSKNTIIMGKKERKRQEIILQALAMHYFLLCHEDVIEIFTTKLMLHANTKIRLRIVLILTPHKQKSTQVSGSFSLPGSFSLVSFIKLLQTKPTKKCQLYISGRDHMPSSRANSSNSQKYLLEIPLVCWIVHQCRITQIQFVPFPENIA